MINVLSLFDGLGGARIALDQLGIECNYYASEVDKYAIKVSTANYPDIIQLGDVRGVNGADLPKIDLLCGGSPCQDLSVAKSGRQGLDGERSGLFWEYVRLIKECKPRYFLLENVHSMPKESRDIISKAMGVSPIMINSALLTAQNRKRYYWTNTGVFMQPMDKGIVLADIIEDGVVDREKSYTLRSHTGGSPPLKQYLAGKFTRQIVFKGCARQPIPRRPKPGVKRKYVVEVRDDYKANALLTKGGMVTTGIYTVPRGFNQGGIRETEKAPSVTSNAYEHNNKLVINPKEFKFIKADSTDKNTDLKFLGGIISGRDKWLKDGKNHSRNFSQGNRVYGVDGKSSSLNASGGGLGAATGLYYTHEGIRKLTPIECERLQGIPDNYTNHVSNSQRYKMIGNGFTIPVIKYILSHADFTKELLND